MISDTLHDAVKDIDDYIATGFYGTDNNDIDKVRYVMQALYCRLDMGGDPLQGDICKMLSDALAALDITEIKRLVEMAVSRAAKIRGERDKSSA